jgi:hypothetical protein
VGDIVYDRIDLRIAHCAALDFAAYRIEAVGLLRRADRNVAPGRLAEPSERRFGQAKIMRAYQRVIVREQQGSQEYF